jgi:sec-independent protein translocase protein TatB
MFGMGIGELVLIFVIALIVFGPEKLPSVARTVGKLARDLKRTTTELTETIQREMDMDEIKTTLDLPAEVRRNVRSIVLPPEEVARRKKEKLKEIEEKKMKQAAKEPASVTDEASPATEGKETEEEINE